METEETISSTLTYDMDGTNFPWKVTMAVRDDPGRTAKMDWCKQNAAGDGTGSIKWIAPRRFDPKRDEDQWWWNKTREIWSFKTKEDAILFRMVWGF